MKKALATLALLAAPATAQAQGKIVSQSNLGSLGNVVESIFSVLILFIPAVATIYLAISGYRYMVAQGNPDLIEKAKKSLTYAVVGVIVAYTSVLIMAYVADSLGFRFGP